MISHMFSAVPAGVDLIAGTHQPGLVLLSVMVSIVMSLLALQISYVARTAATEYYRQIALLTGALALGAGIWAMHFIGMLAYQLPADVAYDTGLTLLSMVPAVLASRLALRLLAHSRLKLNSIVIGGVLVGGGIGLMHYTGMAAMQTSMQMHHDLLHFIVSIVAAVVLAMLAIWIRLGLRKTRLAPQLRFYLAGIVMGLAIVSMHYIAMHGVRFYGETGTVSQGVWVNNVYLALALSSVVLTLGVVVSALNGLVRMRELHRRAGSAQSRLQAIVDTAVDAIITIDSMGIIKDFSRSGERLFGYQASEVLGENVKILMPEPYHSEHDGYLQRYRQTGETQIIGKGRELQARRKDGSVFPIRLSVGKVELDNREPLFVGLIADISARINLETSLREAAQRAEAAAEAKGQFLANISHEIRTPMNSIIGFTELLLQGPLDEIQRSHLHSVLQSSTILLGLINDILDSTKLENLKLELEHNDFSLKSVAMQVESSLRIAAQKKGLDFIIGYPEDMPEYFVGDALRIIQVLNNLVGNAIKFTERGQVEMMFAYTGQQVRVVVSDTGIGMSAEQIASIFEPFTQADASISRRFGGTGLGTTIAKQLVEVMGGRIEVTSEPGQGTVFSLQFPLALGKAPEHQNDQKLVELPPLRILIADDVEQNLRLLRLVLENAGHQVEEAGNGAQALEKFQHGSFDMLLLDVHMPVVDGLQAVQQIRQLEQASQRSRVPVIALTASVMQEDRDAARQAGMDGFASKPLNVPALFAEMSRVLMCVPVKGVTDLSQAIGQPDLINWQQGISLWGSRKQLQQEIHTFLAGCEADYPLILDDPLDTAQLEFSLHGIRGAAGNLGLTAVTGLAAELESQLRSNRLNGLQAGLARLQHLLQESAQQAQPVSPSVAGSRQSATNMAELAVDIAALRQTLARHQLDDELLAKVVTGLESGPVAATRLATELAAAVDGFAFDQALSILDEANTALPGVHNSGADR